MTSLYQFTPLELVLDYDLQITVTWSSRVRALCAASAHPHHLCGTMIDLPSDMKNSNISIDRVFSLALSRGFLSVPILVTGASVNFF